MSESNNGRKRKDMDSIFDDAPEDIGDDDLHSPATNKRQRATSSSTEQQQQNGDHEEANEEDEDEDLFASSPDKQEKQEQQQQQSNKKSNHNASATQRRAGLSKFVRRILDPNREPRGLIEPPQVIPLNDEFLEAFGQREKEFDQKVGRQSEFDQTIPDDEDKDKADNGGAAGGDRATASSKSVTDESGDANNEDNEKKGPCKVKVTNLLYTTSAETLGEECKNFGSVVDVNMILDDSDPEGLRNIGRAYVVFATSEAAQDSVDQQLGGSIDGRPVRVSLADDLSKKSGGGGNSAAMNTAARYYQQDISTKCFRCGQIGHIEAHCPNPPKASICPLCAKADEHDMRACPLNRVCFNCGIPGHINRECPLPRGQPPRQICTICCGSGHNRFSCKRSATNIPGINAAVCCVCNQRGHFMCKDLKWFFGLEGVFCFNCGGRGHVGHQCVRPNLDDLIRNDGWAMTEIDKAEEYKIVDEMEVQRAERAQQEREHQREREQQRQRQREHYREQDRRDHRNRSKSAPPPRSRGYNSGDRANGSEFRYTVGSSNNNNNNSNNTPSNHSRRGGGGGSRGGSTGGNRRKRGY